MCAFVTPIIKSNYNLYPVNLNQKKSARGSGAGSLNGSRDRGISASAKSVPNVQGPPPTGFSNRGAISTSQLYMKQSRERHAAKQRISPSPVLEEKSRSKDSVDSGAKKSPKESEKSSTKEDEENSPSGLRKFFRKFSGRKKKRESESSAEEKL